MEGIKSGWMSKESISETVYDEKKQEVSGEKVLKAWKESFRVLGIEDPKDNRFDVEFGERIVSQQEEIYDASFDSDNYNPQLDAPIHPTETERAIERLKSGKAAGDDQIVAEILKKEEIR